MLDKVKQSLQEAIAPIQDGASVMVSGFGDAGIPFELMSAIMDKGLRELTIISNNAGTHETGIAGLIKAGRVRKIVCSHPRPAHSDVFAYAYRAGQVELECMPRHLGRAPTRCRRWLGTILYPYRLWDLNRRRQRATRDQRQRLHHGAALVRGLRTRAGPPRRSLGKSDLPVGR